MLKRNTVKQRIPHSCINILSTKKTNNNSNHGQRPSPAKKTLDYTTKQLTTGHYSNQELQCRRVRQRNFAKIVTKCRFNDHRKKITDYT